MPGSKQGSQATKGTGKGASGKSKRNILLLFDTDGTLTACGQNITQEVKNLLKAVRQEVTIAVTGGLMLYKMKERLGSDVLECFDYCFPENGTVAFKDGKQIGKKSVSEYLGEENIKAITEYALSYFSKLDLPFRCGTFVDFRTGIINFSPAGRHLAPHMRSAFSKLDSRLGIRKQMQQDFTERFGHLGVEFLIGGAVGMDLVPRGWDKRLSLEYIDVTHYDEVHYFGDKYHPGENDYYLLSDERTVGHPINGPHETVRVIADIMNWNDEQLYHAMTPNPSQDGASAHARLLSLPIPTPSRRRKCIVFDLNALLDVAQAVALGVAGLTPECRASLTDAAKLYDLGVIHNDRYDVVRDALGSDDLGLFRYVFAEYGGVVYENGNKIESRSITEKIGLDTLNKVTQYAQERIVESPAPFRRGTFVDFRTSAIGFSPAGKYISNEIMRDAFTRSDQSAQIRQTFIAAMKAQFPSLGVEFIPWGPLMVDMVPTGWNKRLAAEFLVDAQYTQVHCIEKHPVVEQAGQPLLDMRGVQGRVVRNLNDVVSHVRGLVVNARQDDARETRLGETKVKSFGGRNGGSIPLSLFALFEDTPALLALLLITLLTWIIAFVLLLDHGLESMLSVGSLGISACLSLLVFAIAKRSQGHNSPLRLLGNLSRGLTAHSAVE